MTATKSRVWWLSCFNHRLHTRSAPSTNSRLCLLVFIVDDPQLLSRSSVRASYLFIDPGCCVPYSSPCTSCSSLVSRQLSRPTVGLRVASLAHCSSSGWMQDNSDSTRSLQVIITSLVNKANNISCSNVSLAFFDMKSFITVLCV